MWKKRFWGCPCAREQNFTKLIKISWLAMLLVYNCSNAEEPDRIPDVPGGAREKGEAS